MITRVKVIPNGNVSITSYSFRSAAERRSSENCEKKSGRCSANWRGRKSAGSRRGILCPDSTIHMMLSIPPKHSVSQIMGYIKGKSAIHIARAYGGKKRNFVGENFWAREFFVSIVGRDEEVIRRYIQEQEKEDQRADQLGLWKQGAARRAARGPGGRPAASGGLRYLNPPALPGDT